MAATASRRKRLASAATAIIVLAACNAADPAGSALAADTASAPFSERRVAGFDTPWAMDILPGTPARALLAERGGQLWLVNLDDGTKQPVAGVPSVQVAGQGGLGDVVLHPSFATNARVYLSFVEAGPGGTSGAALGHGTLRIDGDKARLDGFKIIWRQSPKVTGNGHFAHRIAFGPDGLLYLSSGDRQKMAPAQDMGSDLGKILRLTDEGAPAPGNPFADRGGPAAAYWSLGHRNPLGLAFDADGRLWETEMGPKGGDELNLVLPGRNYGWPRASNGSHYDNEAIPDHRAGDGFEAPKAWWTPSISPGGLLVYRGTRFSGWTGDALVPALSGEAIIRVDLDGDKAVIRERWPMGRRIRALDESADGRLFLLEDKGDLVELVPAAAQSTGR